MSFIRLPPQQPLASASCTPHPSLPQICRAVDCRCGVTPRTIKPVSCPNTQGALRLVASLVPSGRASCSSEVRSGVRGPGAPCCPVPCLSEDPVAPSKVTRASDRLSNLCRLVNRRTCGTRAVTTARTIGTDLRRLQRLVPKSYSETYMCQAKENVFFPACNHLTTKQLPPRKGLSVGPSGLVQMCS